MNSQITKPNNMRYVALIRGIGPGNPNMTGPKFKEFFESLGFSNVTTVIASGNVVFETSKKYTKQLEDKIEEEGEEAEEKEGEEEVEDLDDEEVKKLID